VTEGKHSNGSILVQVGKGANAPLIIFPPKNNLLATEMKRGKINCGKTGRKGCMYEYIKDWLNQTSPTFPA